MSDVFLFRQHAIADEILFGSRILLSGKLLHPVSDLWGC
jgi:hypothetical protein